MAALCSFLFNVTKVKSPFLLKSTNQMQIWQLVKGLIIVAYRCTTERQVYVLGLWIKFQPDPR